MDYIPYNASAASLVRLSTQHIDQSSSCRQRSKSTVVIPNTVDNTLDTYEIMSSSSNQLTLPLRVTKSQQGKRQREESEDEPQAKRVRWADLQPEPIQQASLLPSHNDDDEIVENVTKVLVDDNKHQFFVRQDKICASSRLFRAMVSSTSHGSVAHFFSTSSDEFRTYLHWLKTKEVSLEIWFGCTGRDPELTEQQELQAWIDIYVLAENFDDRKLRNFVMKVFIKNCPDLRTIPGGGWCATIWKQTSQGSRLRTFIVEWTFFRFAGLVKSARFAKVALTYPEEFREQFVGLAFSEKGLPPSGSRPNKIAKQAFQDEMRAKLLERRSR